MALEENVKEFGVTYFGMKDRRQGIVHVIGPEQGFTVSALILHIWLNRCRRYQSSYRVPLAFAETRTLPVSMPA